MQLKIYVGKETRLDKSVLILDLLISYMNIVRDIKFPLDHRACCRVTSGHAIILAS